MSPEAVRETNEKLLPQHQIYDFRKGQGTPLAEIGHEAVLGSMHITEPDMAQKPVTFKTEKDALVALKSGVILESTPIIITG